MDEESGSSTSVSVSSFVAARAKEIAALSLQISASSSVENKGLAFQHVPKHMRRRAVSHNVKRLPKRLQQVHLGQLTKSSGGQKKKPKTPSRKHRRRKSNLLSEFNRRQREVKWLETHIWHAKRFHMDKKWNHKIPVAPCDKGYRALYRAFRDCCAMRDISFYSCIQISGPYEELCEQFRRITDPSVDRLGIGARYYASRTREGNLHIYEESQFPFGYIGEVMFSWAKDSVLWLWVHPGYKSQVVDQLIQIFDLSPQLNFSKPKPTPTNLSIDQIKMEPKDLPCRPRWTSSDSNIVVTDLEGALNRIRLVGEETFSVLKETLHTSPEVLPSTDSKSTWFSDFFLDNPEALKLQSVLWNSATTCDDFYCQTILPLTVRDPRIFLPKCREKLSEVGKKRDEEGREEFIRLRNEYLAKQLTPLVDGNMRERILMEKMSDNELSKRRAQLLIPGSDLHLGAEENQIPVLLIRQAESGWDLILPAGWTMAFWIPFSYRCVRAFGHRDALHYAFEYRSVHSVEIPQPDSLFGQQEAEAAGNVGRETYFRYPPAKRENFIKLKCPFPFTIDWHLLLKHNANKFKSTIISINTDPRFNNNFQTFKEQANKFFVLRNISVLEMLDTELRRSKSVGEMQTFKYIPIPNGDRCLIGIGLTIEGRGRPGPMAVISIPDEGDVGNKVNLLREGAYSCGFVNRRKKEIRQRHQKELAFFRKKRRKMRDKAAEGKIEPSAAKHYDSTQLSREFQEEFNSLCVPDPNIALNAMSRTPIGCVTMGGDAYRVGKSSAFGYVTYFGLCAFLRKVNCWDRKNLVLVRDASKSLEYSQAKIHIFKELL